MKSGGVVSVLDFGAIGDGVTDCASAFNAAINYAVSSNIREISIPSGDYNVESPIYLQRRLSFVGQGRGNGLYPRNIEQTPTRITSSSSDMFSNLLGETGAGVNGQISEVRFENIGFYSKSGGGHIFNLNAITTAMVNNIEFFRVAFDQMNADKRMIWAPADGDFFKVDMHSFSMAYPIGTTVPMFDFVGSAAINNINLKTFTCLKSDTSDNTGTYAIRIDRTSGGFCNNISISEGVLQQPLGGFLDIGGPQGLRLSNLGLYDADTTNGNPIFNIRATTGGVQPDSVVMESVNVLFGTSGVPDLNFSTTSGNTGLVLINCAFEYVDLGGSPRYCTAIGKSPVLNTKLVNGKILQIRGQGIRSIQNDGIETISFINEGVFLIDGATIGLASATPAALTVTTNNYDPSSSNGFILASATTPISITGMVGGSNGKIRVVRNTGANNITMTNNDASSTAANRFRNTGGSSVVLAQYDAIQYIYDGTETRWVQI
jgi:hypothetical protein